MTVRMYLAVIVLLCCAVGVYAEPEPFASDPDSRKYAVILVGASFGEEDRQRFQRWATQLRTSLLEDYHYPRQQITLLLGNTPAGEHNSDGVCEADTIAATFSRLAQQMRPGDQLMVVLIGHGTGAGGQAKFNSVGPDYNGAEFAALLAPLPSQNLVVVNTTAASHDFTQALAAPGRVLVSATRSAAEKYHTLFPQYWIEGLQQQRADRDKNGRVSLLESFHYAKTQVNQHYRQQDILPAEHPVLGDSGDGDFSHDPGRRGNGQLAEVAYVDLAPARNQSLSPQARQLRAAMDKLERDIFSLRNAKAELDQADYWSRLESLLIELAKTTQAYQRQIEEVNQ